MAQFTAFATGAIALLMIVLIILMTWMTYRFDELRHQTNHLMDKLLIRTASDSEAKGDLAGRAGLAHEQEVARAVVENKEKG